MVSTMFYSNTFIHMVRLVLLVAEVEDPWSSFIHLGCNFKIHTRSTKYDGYGHTESHPSMGPLYVINGHDFNHCTCKMANTLSMCMATLAVISWW